MQGRVAAGEQLAAGLCAEPINAVRASLGNERPLPCAKQHQRGRRGSGGLR